MWNINTIYNNHIINITIIVNIGVMWAHQMPMYIDGVRWQIWPCCFMMLQPDLSEKPYYGGFIGICTIWIVKHMIKKAKWSSTHILTPTPNHHWSGTGVTKMYTWACRNSYELDIDKIVTAILFTWYSKVQKNLTTLYYIVGGLLRAGSRGESGDNFLGPLNTKKSPDIKNNEKIKYAMNYAYTSAQQEYMIDPCRATLVPGLGLM